MTLNVNNANRSNRPSTTMNSDAPAANVSVSDLSSNLRLDIDRYGAGLNNRAQLQLGNTANLGVQAPQLNPDAPVFRGGALEHMPSTILGQQRLPNEVETKAALAEARSRYHDWMKHHPGVKQPSDGQYSLGDILDGKGDMKYQEQSLRIILMILNESPAQRAELYGDININIGGGGGGSDDDIHLGIPGGEIPSGGPASPDFSSSPGPEAPAAPAAPAAPPQQDPMAGIMNMLGPVAQVAGPIMQIAGGILASPIGIMGLTAAVAAIPGAQPIAPFVPLIAMAGGFALTAGGGMVGQWGNQQVAQQKQQAAASAAAAPVGAAAAPLPGAPATPGAAPAAGAAPAGGMPLDPNMMLQMFQTLAPMIGGLAGAMGGGAMPGATPAMPAALPAA